MNLAPPLPAPRMRGDKLRGDKLRGGGLFAGMTPYNAGHLSMCSVIHITMDTLPALAQAAIPLEHDEAALLAELFRALGDASRIRILSAIAEHERNVSAIAELAEISESAVSHHMRGLRQLRLVRARKDGREVFYALDDDHVADLFRRGLEHVRHG